MEEALEFVRAKYTKERVAGVERLRQLLESSRKTFSASEVTSLVDACLDLSKDRNFRVSLGALQALAAAAVLAGEQLKLHFNALVPAVVERLGDAKQSVREAARRLLIVLMEVSSPTIIFERAGPYAWSHKSWRVREEFVRTVTSAIDLFVSSELPLQQTIFPPMLQMLNDTNPGVREAAAAACIELKNINAGLEENEPKVISSEAIVSNYSSSDTKPASLKLKKDNPKSKSSASMASLFGDIEISGIGQNGKNQKFERNFPERLRSMINLFELNVRLPTNQLLADKPLCDGSPLSRSRSDVARRSPLGGQMEDNVVKIASDFQTSYSNRKSIETPMKMLIAQEMSKELDSKINPPNVVARLMGLDALPTQETGSSIQRIRSRGHPRSHSDIPMSYCEQQNEFSQYVEPDEFKDVFEILQSPHTGNETTNDDRMTFVRRKFAEAKRLSMDEKLRQSRQFHDALEVLNTNKDLFIKCLQEPNSMFSQDLDGLQSIPPPSETKRITVLRPSKMVDNINFLKAANKDRIVSQKGAFVLPDSLERGHLVDSPPAGWKNYEIPCQPTRIVVLKPSPVKTHDIKTLDSPQSDAPREQLPREEFFGDAVDNENHESREVAKAITQRMREKLGKHNRDEALISSVFSNGFDEESSFNKSEIEYSACNLSDSEVLSPVSRHSWDYNNRFGSPYSSSSFSRVSYSPESSVCREAKKRLSERWAMMASNRSYIEQRHVRRRSSTLGEMLALSETTKAALSRGENNLKEPPKDSNPVINTDLRTPDDVNNSPKNLMRSKSVPVSPSECGTTINTDLSVSDKGRPEVPKEETKEKHVKLSFRGKVSSLFFSRNKKANKEKSVSPEIKEVLSKISPERMDSQRNSGPSDEGPERVPCSPPKPSSKVSSLSQYCKQGKLFPETGLSTEQYITSGHHNENLDQPSPISVLDQPFEEDQCAATLFSRYVKPELRSIELPINTIRSNLIDKSPPIGSIARTLSWDNSFVDSVSQCYLSQSITSRGTEEEREWLFFVKTLLTTADMQGEVQLNTFLARWHSPESPLDPSLRDKYIDLKEKETLHEAQRRLKRSTQKLVFDCVDASLVEIAGYGSVFSRRAVPCIESNKILENSSFTILDEVWARMKTFLSGGIEFGSDDCGEDNGLILERMVRKEVVGVGWSDHLRLMADNIGNAMEQELLEELVQEAVAELAGTA